ESPLWIVECENHLVCLAIEHHGIARGERCEIVLREIDGRRSEALGNIRRSAVMPYAMNDHDQLLRSASEGLAFVALGWSLRSASRIRSLIVSFRFCISARSHASSASVTRAPM